jgi:tripartite-type tricarboxylate transporter receptor subunit TctC
MQPSKHGLPYLPSVQPSSIPQNFRGTSLAKIGAALCAALMSTLACADYPARPIRLIVSNGPGSVVDATARMIGQRLTEAWGKQVVIDNRAGAGGVIAHELAAQAPRDGYTLLFSTSAGLVINPLLLKLTYDPQRDFAPVSLAVINPQMLIAYPGMGATGVSQLLAMAKSKPGKLNCGSTGNGTSNHLGCELLKSMGNVNFVHVPYKSTSAAITATVAGEVDFLWNSMPAVYPLAKAGKLRALGIGAKKRVAAAPEVPTIAETIPGFECQNWYAMLAPRGTSAPIITKLNAEMVKMFAEPAFAQKLVEQGSEPQTTTPAGLAGWMRQDSERWSKVIKQTGLAVR